jgi:hypothetical protein
VATLTGCFPHILPPPPPNKNEKSCTRGLFRLSAFGRFLGCLFLGHCASFPRGWTPQRAKTVDAAPQNLTGAIIRKFALLREPYHSLRTDSHITPNNRASSLADAQPRQCSSVDPVTALPA